MTVKCLLFMLIVAVGIEVVASPEMTQAQSSDEIVTLDGRPLAAAIWELENRFGWIITYEDPPHEWSGDFEDVAPVVRRDGKRDPVIVLRERSFVFDLRNRDPKRPQELLSSMLAQYNSSGYNDAFRLIQRGRFYHVVPARSANASGDLAERRSLLDVRLTVEAANRRVLDMLALILQRVTSATEQKLVVGTVPQNLLYQKMMQGGASNEVARDLLARTLAATGVNLSWRVLCLPGAIRQCAFNVHAVPTPKG